MERVIPCKTEYLDRRCPDGCCGMDGVLITSPRTGDSIFVGFRYMTGTSRDRVRDAFKDHELPERGFGPALMVGYTPAELKSLLASSQYAE